MRDTEVSRMVPDVWSRGLSEVFWALSSGAMVTFVVTKPVDISGNARKYLI